MSKDTIHWRVIVCGYVLLMYVSTFIISASKLLEDRELVSVVFLIVCILAAIALLILGFYKFGLGNHYAWIYMGFIAALLMIAAFNLSDPKGRFHFLEYALLFILAYRMLKQGIKGYINYALAIILVFVVGLVDEVLQSFYPNGFMDPSDIMNNTFAGFLAAGAMLVWEKC